MRDEVSPTPIAGPAVDGADPPTGIRRFTTLGAWALTDQVLSSLTNFGAGIVVARTAGPAGFGSFTLAFGSWVVLRGVTRSMLVQPYTVVASGTAAQDWRDATRATAAASLAAGIIFGIAAIGVGAVIGIATPTGSAFAVLGVFAAPLALQDFWRFAAFSRSTPRAAAANDGVWAIVEAFALAAMVTTNRLTPATAIASWGVGALAGALFGFWQFQVRPSLGSTQRGFIRQNAALAGWFGVENASYMAGYYGAQLLVWVGLGPAALGGLGSALTLMGPALLVASAGEAVVLPIAAREARGVHRRPLGRLCNTYSVAFAGFFAIAGMALVWLGPSVFRFVFGEDYVPFTSLLPPIVATAVVSGLASGQIMGLRALGEARGLAALQTVSSVAKIAVIALLLQFGLVYVVWGLAVADALRAVLGWAMLGRAIPRRVENPESKEEVSD